MPALQRNDCKYSEFIGIEALARRFTMETLNHLINNLKEGLYVCGEKQKFERFFGSLSLERRIKFILRELRNTTVERLT